VTRERDSRGKTGVRTTVVCPGLVQTNMFAGVSLRFPFLTPPVRVDDLADEIVDALLTRDREQIWIPFAAYLLMLLRWLPAAWGDRIQQVRVPRCFTIARSFTTGILCDERLVFFACRQEMVCHEMIVAMTRHES
jgi:NAD(P)-dependent dehydrogenase (short-subunit alcohol dehydrogenase family)